MKQVEFDETADTLVIDRAPPVKRDRISAAFAGALEQVSDVSLVSFREAARKFVRKTSAECLQLRWADYPTKVFEDSPPPLEFVSLVSDGVSVSVAVRLSLYAFQEYPEDAEAVSAMLSHSVDPILREYGATIESLDVGPYSPTWSRRVAYKVGFPPQRRTVGEANLFGRALRQEAEGSRRELLGSPDGVLRALSVAPAALIGQAESQWLEAKRRPYDLSAVSQKSELAKDVAAMANADGGVIVFGFATRRESGLDVISKATPFDIGGLSPRRYMQVLRARIYPHPGSLEIRHVTGGGRIGLAYICVPPQPEELKPFVLHETTSRSAVRSTSLTIPIRVGGHIEYSSPESIHSLIVAGRVALNSVHA